MKHSGPAVLCGAAWVEGATNRRHYVLLVPPPEAGMCQGHLWQTRKAIYGLVGGPGEFYRTIGDFSRKDGVWETQADFTSAQTALDRCVYEIAKVSGREDSFLASDSGADGGEEIVGMMSTRVDDLLLVADDDARELVGQVSDIRFDSL